jgi:hypothetical protein
MGRATRALRPPIGPLPELATRRRFIIHACSAAQRLASEEHAIRGAARAFIGAARFHKLLTGRYRARNRIVRSPHEASSMPLRRTREEEEVVAIIEQLLMLLWGVTPAKRRSPRVMLER